MTSASLSAASGRADSVSLTATEGSKKGSGKDHEILALTSASLSAASGSAESVSLTVSMGEGARPPAGPAAAAVMVKARERMRREDGSE